MKKKEYGDEKIEFEKKFSHINISLSDSARKIRQTES